MRKFFVTAVASMAIFHAGSIAVLSFAEAAYCEAKSRYASGWGSGSLSYARQRALYECAVRTPRGHNCYITYCRR